MDKTSAKTKPEKGLDSIVIKFAGDSGDGIQLVGGQFATTSAMAGNDLSTLPDYPAEIRAPTGSLGGVSGFQINFGLDNEVLTPGSKADVLLVMNPAALQVNIENMEPGGIIIANSDAFTQSSLEKANYKTNPLEDGSLSNYRVIPVPVITLIENVLKDMDLTKSQMARCKNFYLLGIMYWMYELPVEPTLRWMEEKFKKNPNLVETNKKVLMGGHSYAETTEIFDARFSVHKEPVTPGRYRNLTGNEAIAYGLIAASKLAKKELYYGSYPITPASEILQELAKHKSFGVKVFQAEDEIAAACSCIGAAFAGNLAATGTSGPGFSLKMEAIDLAVMTELPLVIINVQRGGPSTGLPTKTEQSDLLEAVFGRHGESPVVVLASATSADCFNMVVEASRIAIKYMTPVILLSDSYLANGSEPFRIPELRTLPKFEMPPMPPADKYKPYMRDPQTLARPWAVAGTPGYEHRVGGLEKTNITGEVSYDANNHDMMTHFRSDKIFRVVKEIPPTKIFGKPEGDLLVMGWGSTYGAITSAVHDCQKAGLSVSSVHIKYLNPLPPDLGVIMRRFRRILVPEGNMGQFKTLLSSRFLIDPIGFNKIHGQPLKVIEVKNEIERIFKTR